LPARDDAVVRLPVPTGPLAALGHRERAHALEA
jgi:hypothetical protein